MPLAKRGDCTKRNEMSLPPRVHLASFAVGESGLGQAIAALAFDSIFTAATLTDIAAVDATDRRRVLLTAADYATITATLRDVLDDVMESTAQEGSILQIANKLKQLTATLSNAQTSTESPHPMLLITNLCREMPCTVTRMRSHALPYECSHLFPAACAAKRVVMEQFALLNIPIFDFRSWDDLAALPRIDRDVEWSIRHTPSLRDLGGQLYKEVLDWTVDKLALLHPPAAELDEMGLPTRSIHDEKIDLGPATDHTDTYASYAAMLIRLNGVLGGILERKVEPDTFLFECPVGVPVDGNGNKAAIEFAKRLQFAFVTAQSAYVDLLIEDTEPEMAQRIKDFGQANETHRLAFKKFIRFKCWSKRADIRLTYFDWLYEGACESFGDIVGSQDRHVVCMAEQQAVPRYNIILKDDDEFSMLHHLFPPDRDSVAWSRRAVESA